jgi:hypothetical protein
MPAIFKAFTMIGKQPEIQYTDDEGALTQTNVAAEFERAGIQHIVTSSSAHFVERFNRTFKLMVSQRMKVLKRGFRLRTKQPPTDTSTIQWSDLIPSVSAEYNNKSKHRITSMTPAEARKPSNEAYVKMAKELVAGSGWKYPIWQIGDLVGILRNMKVIGDKEWMGQLNKGEHTIESISENSGPKFWQLIDGKGYVRSDIVRFKN